MNQKSQLVIAISSSGKCPRALSAELLSYSRKEQPKWLSTAAEEGNLHEDAIKAKLRNEGYIIEDNRQECEICKARYGTGRKGLHVEIDLDIILLVGHMDGKILNLTNANGEDDNKYNILECKSMSQYEFDRWMKEHFLAFPAYADQITCYGIASNINKILYVVKNRNNGYTEKTLLAEYPSNFEEIKNRLLDIYEHVQQNKLVEIEYDPEDIWCKRCGYISLCIPEPTELTPATIQQLQIQIDLRKKAKAIIWEQEGIIAYAERVIENYLITNKRKNLRIGGWTITLGDNKPRVTYSKEDLLLVGVTNEQLLQSGKLSEVKKLYRLYMKNLNKDKEE